MLDLKKCDFRGEFRQRMPVCEKYAYFDHAAVAPITRAAADAVARWTHQALYQGDVPWLEWAAELQKCRTAAAELLNASPEEIALVPNTTLGIHYIATGIRWKPGDRVVAVANEFPSNLLAWKQLAEQGVEIALYQPESDGKIDLSKLLELVNAKTRLVAISWVGFATGFRIDPQVLADEVHRRGALLLLDAIQGLGVFALDTQVAEVDFAVADGHKWLLGPEGAGVLYIRKLHLEALKPVGVGWNSVTGSFSFAATDLNWRPSAARYEGGSHSMPGFIGFSASLKEMAEMRQKYGKSIWEECVLENANYAYQLLLAAGAEVSYPSTRDHRSGIISFRWSDEDPSQTRLRCLRAGVVLSCRLGRLRISPHGYNNEEDCHRLIEALKSVDV